LSDQSLFFSAPILAVEKRTGSNTDVRSHAKLKR
jgi:hypothetical protein